MAAGLFRSLEREWKTVLVPGSRAVLARWAATEPVLAGVVDFDDLLGRLRCGGEYAVHDSLLLALLRIGATEEAAARVVLQAMIPGLAGVARRRRGLACAEEVAAEVIAAAWERIRTYPCDRRQRRVAANIVLDVRQWLVRHDRWWRDPVEWAALDDLNGAAERGVDRAAVMDGGDDGDGAGHSSLVLGRVLADRVRRRCVSTREAQIIWLSRSYDVPVRKLAAEFGMDERNVRQCRARAERRLRVIKVQE